MVKWFRAVLFFLAVAVLMIASTGTSNAACPGIVNHIFGHFDGCGANPSAFFWQHGRAVQRILSNNSNQNTTAGHDSGPNQFAPGMYVPYLDTGGNPVPGSFQGATDFGNQDSDGCIFNIPEVDCAANPTGTCTGGATCSGGVADYGPLDYVIVGVDPAAPNVARFAAVSVDFNEAFQAWTLDNAGAPPGGAPDPCSADAVSFGPEPIPCSAIPPPVVTQVLSTTPTSATLNVRFDPVAALVTNSIKDDCNVAETAATNCQGGRGGSRNLYQGRVLVFKRGACTASTGASFDRRSYVMPGPPFTVGQIISPNFTVFSSADANLNGIRDAGEAGKCVNGTNPGTICNLATDCTGAGGVCQLAPFLVNGTSTGLENLPVTIPLVSGASDCLFLGVGILLDTGAGNINPGPTPTLFGEQVIAPAVSVNNSPIRSGSGTPVADLVTTISASKSQGKGTVNWDTGIEMTTAGFNVIGTKKNSGETKLNGSLIAAKEGTSGKGASYTVTFDAGQLKGSSSVFVEIVKTDGSKERFGPASF